jgi:hypothetical protein
MVSSPVVSFNFSQEPFVAFGYVPCPVSQTIEMFSRYLPWKTK